MEFKWFSKLSLQSKLTVNALIVSMMTLCVLTFTLLAQDDKAASASLNERLEATAKLIAGHSAFGVQFEDSRSLVKILDTLSVMEWVDQAYVWKIQGDDETKGTLISEFVKRQGVEPPATLEKESGLTASDTHITVWEPIKLGNNKIGMLFLHSSLKELETLHQQKVSILTATIIATVIFVWFLSKIMQDSLTRPIQELSAAARQVARTQDYSARARKFSDDEVGDLVSQFNEMLSKVQQADKERQAAAKQILKLNQDLDNKVQTRVKELTSTNGELTIALDTLKETQRQLVENEKMASLGSLVAGVAHEINTPVGISVTAASHLIQEIDDLHALYESKQMKKGDMSRMMDTCKESCEIVLNNLQRAAALIRSFKKVAVDRSDETPQEYNPKMYLEDVLTSLQAKFRNTEHEVETSCIETIAYGYPGAFGQIITNLVDNSLQHAFDDGRAGKIYISLVQEGENLILEYSDNGMGMPPENLKNLFEPFFTTKRGSGGAGLGAHILYNLVTQTLGGAVKASCEEGEGLKVRVVFPLRIEIEEKAEKPEASDSSEVTA